MLRRLFQPAARLPAVRAASAAPPMATELPQDALEAPGPVQGPRLPNRADLDARLAQVQQEHGMDSPATALRKTNTKYMMIKQYGPSCLAESDDAEGTASLGMMNLVNSRSDLMGRKDCGAHHEVQALDSAYHNDVVSKPDHPYGPLTTAVTRMAPIGLRALYSKGTSKVPHFTGGPSTTTE